MAHSTLVFRNPNFGTIKRAPVGFSWTTFFWGFWPALLRSDFKWAAIILVVSVVVSAITMGFGLIVTAVAFGIIYNKMYIRDLIAAGYLVERVESGMSIDQLAAELETVLPRDPNSKF